MFRAGRAGGGFSPSPSHEPLPVPVAGRQVRQGARRRPRPEHGLGGGRRCHGRRGAGGAGPGRGVDGGRPLLDGISAELGAAGPKGRAAGHQRRTKLRRNSVQKGPSSVNPTSRPSTSRSPASVTPTATTKAIFRTRPPSRTLTYLASSHRYGRSEEHTSELQSRPHLVCRLLLEKKNNNYRQNFKNLNLNLKRFVRTIVLQNAFVIIHTRIRIVEHVV